MKKILKVAYFTLKIPWQWIPWLLVIGDFDESSFKRVVGECKTRVQMENQEAESTCA